MTEKEILDQIAEIARQDLGWTGQVEPEMRLVEELELDSLGQLALAIEIENRFRICLDAEDEAALETVGDLVQAVVQKRGSASAG